MRAGLLTHCVNITNTVNCDAGTQVKIHYPRSSALNRSANQGTDSRVYARTVTMSVKAGALAAFTELIESEIIPIVRRLEGFQDALTLIEPDGRDAVGISLWSRRADADRYGRSAEREVMSRLSGLLDDFGPAKTLRLSNSTFHKIGTRVPL